ncbi:MAG: GNAT family N-acetyltransferase [Myxococcaceae bacterium]
MGALAGEVLHTFGDYGRLLPQWMQRGDIHTYLAFSACSPIGFSMIGAGVDERTGLYADLLAIAVAPERHGQGTGRLLLRHAIDTAALSFPELRLSVAEGNSAARSLFESEGFAYVDRELGTYSQGQRALRMARQLSVPMR